MALPDPGELVSRSEQLANARVIVGGPVTKEQAGAATSLRLFHVFRGGTDGLGVEHLAPNVAVCNTYQHERSVAEFAVLAMLALPRRVFFHDQQLRRGSWRGSVMWGEPPEQEELTGK